MDKLDKSCGKCNKKHTKLPEKTKYNEHGAWFNCECGSTLFVPNRKLRKLSLTAIIEILKNHPDVAFLDVTMAKEINEMEGA